MTMREYNGISRELTPPPPPFWRRRQRRQRLYDGRVAFGFFFFFFSPQRHRNVLKHNACPFSFLMVDWAQAITPSFPYRIVPGAGVSMMKAALFSPRVCDFFFFFPLTTAATNVAGHRRPNGSPFFFFFFSFIEIVRNEGVCHSLTSLLLLCIGAAGKKKKGLHAPFLFPGLRRLKLKRRKRLFLIPFSFSPPANPCNGTGSGEVSTAFFLFLLYPRCTAGRYHSNTFSPPPAVSVNENKASVLFFLVTRRAALPFFFFLSFRLGTQQGTPYRLPLPLVANVMSGQWRSRAFFFFSI